MGLNRAAMVAIVAAISLLLLACVPPAEGQRQVPAGPASLQIVPANYYTSKLRTTVRRERFPAARGKAAREVIVIEREVPVNQTGPGPTAPPLFDPAEGREIQKAIKELQKDIQDTQIKARMIE